MDLIFWLLYQIWCLSNVSLPPHSKKKKKFLSKNFLGAEQIVSGDEVGKKQKTGKWKHDHYLCLFQRNYVMGQQPSCVDTVGTLRWPFICFLTGQEP